MVNNKNVVIRFKKKVPTIMNTELFSSEVATSDVT